MTKVRITMGQETMLDEPYLYKLLMEFRETLDTGKRVELRNKIILALEPAVIASTKKYSNLGHLEDIDDIRQDVRVDIIESLHKWTPYRKGTIGGFFRTLIRHECYDMLRIQGERKVKTSPLPDEDFEHPVEQYKDMEFERVEAETHFTEPELSAYLRCIEWLPNLQHEFKGLGKLQDSLCEDFGLSHRGARRLIDHAKVTYRMELLEKVDDIDLEEYIQSIPSDTLFFRLLPYIKDTGNIQEILKIFSGLQIQIPNTFKLDDEEEEE